MGVIGTYSFTCDKCGRSHKVVRRSEESVPDPKDFLAALCEMAGVSHDQTFNTIVMGDVSYVLCDKCSKALTVVLKEFAKPDDPVPFLKEKDDA